MGADYGQLERMVRDQIRSRGIRHAGVLDAMGRVDRRLFVCAEEAARAYEDSPLPIGYGQTISQPYIVALMSELLDPAPGARILEIGAGSGYQTAILAQLGARVHALEIVEALAERARALLDRLGVEGVEIRTGDGWGGWPEAAPFDGILIAAAPPVFPRLLVGQLVPGGRLVLPVGREGGQRLQVVTRTAAGGYRVENGLAVRFVPMTGRAQHAEDPASDPAGEGEE